MINRRENNCCAIIEHSGIYACNNFIQFYRSNVENICLNWEKVIIRDSMILLEERNFFFYSSFFFFILIFQLRRVEGLNR